MKAAWYEKNGEAKDVLVVGEMETPKPEAGEVLVRLATSGVNPSDVKSRRGRPLIGPRIVPHSDGAGIIEAVGAGVDRARVGERVWLWNGQWKRTNGTAAEYIALPARQAVPLPGATGFDAGACFGIPGLTAAHGVALAEAAPGMTILVTGAASGVGHYAVQMAAARGARVIGTASAKRADHARAAGASDIIDYKQENVAARVKELTGGKGADVIIDMDLGTTLPMLADGVLAQYGKLVCYGSNAVTGIEVPFGPMLWNALTLQLFLVYELRPEERAEAEAVLDKMQADGTLVHTIGARFPLEKIAEAHEAIEAGEVIGNVILEF